MLTSKLYNKMALDIISRLQWKLHLGQFETYRLLKAVSLSINNICNQIYTAAQLQLLAKAVFMAYMNTAFYILVVPHKQNPIRWDWNSF